MYSAGVAGNHFCSINDAIPTQSRSTEDAAQWASRRELIDDAVCVTPRHDNKVAPPSSEVSPRRWPPVSAF